MKTFKKHSESESRDDRLRWRAGDVELIDPLSSKEESARDRLTWKKGDVEVENPELREDSLGDHPLGVEHAHENKTELEEHEPSADDREYFDNYHNRELDSDHRSVINMYKSDSGPFNRSLRKSTKSQGSIVPSKSSHYTDSQTHAANLKNIKMMQEVTSHPTPSHMTVFKGVDADAGFHMMKPGQHFIDHGFAGTSFDPKMSLNEFSGTNSDHRNLSGRKILAKIHVPAGSQGHFLDVDQNHRLSHEKEFLLQRGSRFRVNGHYTSEIPAGGDFDHRAHVIDMTLVGQHPKNLINSYESNPKYDMRPHERVLKNRGFSSEGYGEHTHPELGKVILNPEKGMWRHFRKNNSIYSIGSGTDPMHLNQHLKYEASLRQLPRDEE